MDVQRTKTEPVRVRGRIRDEFQCIITQQIFRDPVVARDGHTYERTAITQWLANNKTSPKTKEEMSSDDLVPNLNLKRLILDLLGEGGQGLAYKPTTAEEAGMETLIGFEQVMVLRCQGPAESDWFGKTYMVTREGISGGRRRNSHASKESMVFTDSTVSRRHFDISYGVLEGPGMGGSQEGFWIQDLGSAGGTYIRLPFGRSLPLVDGVMLLVGKHQFVVLSPARHAELASSSSSPAQTVNMDESQSAADGGPNAQLKALLGNPPQPLVGADGRPKVVLRCFAPEGSPMQHREFEVGMEGASIGRKQSNAVSLSQEKGDEVLGLDSAVSGEHCRVEYRSELGGFVLLDGTADKGSTNGTWLRLSFMHQPSHRQILQRDDEVLIGGILRFVVSFDISLMEREVPADEQSVDSSDSAATSPEHVKLEPMVLGV